VLKRRTMVILVLLIIFEIFVINIFWQANLNTVRDKDILFQVSSFNTFSLGNYRGSMTYRELSHYGDFGIGTFEGLNGEMIAIDGMFYQILVDGKPAPVDVNIKTPYATVTFFDPDQTVISSTTLNYSELMDYIDSILPDKDTIFAIKVTGFYSYAKTRSVPGQIEPYLPLIDVLKNQSIFLSHDVQATAIGFWFPQSFDGIDSVGYHFHLITNDRTAGGHLLDCTIRNATIQIDPTSKFHLVLS